MVFDMSFNERIIANLYMLCEENRGLQVVSRGQIVCVQLVEGGALVSKIAKQSTSPSVIMRIQSM